MNTLAKQNPLQPQKAYLVHFGSKSLYLQTTCSWDLTIFLLNKLVVFRPALSSPRLSKAINI